MGIMVFSANRIAFISGVAGVLIGLLCFGVNYLAAANVMPGYELLTTPARLMLSLFTEELAFTIKMILFLSGQFFGYGALAFIFCRVYSWGKNKKFADID